MIVSESRQRVNSAGLDLIKSYESLAKAVFEGDRLVAVEAYQDMVNVWTIGYGHTQTAKPNMRITPSEAESLLLKDIAAFEDAVSRSVQVPLTGDRFSALVAFAFNVGAGAFSRSTLLKKLNRGDYAGAADQFPMWNKAGDSRSLGLTRRRLSERALFLSQPWEGYRSYEGALEPNIVVASLRDEPSASNSSPDNPPDDSLDSSADAATAFAPPDRADAIPSQGRKLWLTEPMQRGDDVEQLQRALKAKGFFFNTTGFFDKITEAVVKDFQQQQKLTPDGIVGALTRKALGLE